MNDGQAETHSNGNAMKAHTLAHGVCHLKRACRCIVLEHVRGNGEHIAAFCNSWWCAMSMPRAFCRSVTRNARRNMCERGLLRSVPEPARAFPAARCTGHARAVASANDRLRRLAATICPRYGIFFLCATSLHPSPRLVSRIMGHAPKMHQQAIANA